jgi:hypothetical protein
VGSSCHEKQFGVSLNSIGRLGENPDTNLGCQGSTKEAAEISTDLGFMLTLAEYAGLTKRLLKLDMVGISI